MWLPLSRFQIIGCVRLIWLAVVLGVETPGVAAAGGAALGATLWRLRCWLFQVHRRFLFMALVMTSAPALEPVTIVEAKDHLRVDGTVEDVLISSLIVTSRLHVEQALGLALITQSWQLVLDSWPGDGVVRVPMRPLQSVSAVKVYASDGSFETVDPSRFVVDRVGEPPRLVGSGTGWPHSGRVVNGIEIEFVAGYGPSPGDVPSPIRHAVMLLVAHWYEHRDPVEIGSSSVSIPASVSRLLKPYRMARI